MTKKRVIILLAAASLLILAFKGKKLLEQRTQESTDAFLPRERTIAVRVVKPKTGTLESRSSYLAQIEAKKSVNLSTKLTGYIKSIPIKESDRVQKGEPLVHIDDKELRSSINALKATLEEQDEALLLAKSIHSRNKKLYDAGGLAKEQYDLSALSVRKKESLVKNTKEKIRQIENQLSYLHIEAPFDGEVARILLQEGDLASAGKPILIFNTLERKALFSYPLESASTRIGQKVLMEDKEVGKIKAIYTRAANGLVQAEVAFHSMIPLPSGISANIDVLTRQAEGCMLPVNSVIHQKEGDYVMVYKEGEFIPRKIDIILEEGQNALIETCVDIPYVAQGNENKLKKLPVYGKIHIAGE